ncbi:MAG: MutS-related protein [Chitinophagaceae bacterium]
MPLSTYQQLLSLHTLELNKLKGKLSFLSTIRLISFIAGIVCGYYFFITDRSLLLVLSIILLGIFLYLIRRYDQTKKQYDTCKAIVQINQTEINLLNGQPSPYEEGNEYIDPHHPYSYDLDLFGKSSLYGFINRTTTSFGRTTLAQALLHPDTSVLEQRQEAITELNKIISFRQRLQAAGLLHSSEEKKLDRLTGWLTNKPVFKKPFHYYVLLIFPALAIIMGTLFFITGTELFKTITGLLVVLNLGIAFSFARSIMSTISLSGDINKTLKQFSDQLVLLEKESFKAPILLKLQQGLKKDTVWASSSIKNLASYFDQLDYVFNIFISPLLNGFFLYHVHVLFILDKWRATHRTHLMNWLQLIGEAESLSSFACFYFNNPDFTIPTVTAKEDLTTISMGHPLIRKEKRITNDISFLEKKFVVLTGSNMSGKSTFLRTLGINLLLARAGSAVCATTFTFFPYDVYVSMRITDSLQDSESFFYAELKRLQTIISHLNAGNKTFIILDEILRGTNSNDKHGGTVGLIHKLVASKACGIIATHDLSVGELAIEYPVYINNNCFESEIINNELKFDYKIKEGVCTKLSASFLMKKMGIIG